MQEHLLLLIADFEELLLQPEIMPKWCQILSESVSVLRFQVPVDIGHQLIKALGKALLLVDSLQTKPTFWAFKKKN